MPRIGNKPSGGSTPDAPDTTWPSNAPADPVQTPLDFLLAIMRNPEIPRSERVDAANKAAPYLHSKHATVDHRSSDGSMRPTIIFEGMPTDASGKDQ
ncbi:hypothetical protein ASC89_27885 [Devosia sp. Root413D1]|uniref:hypothetical protein n=1 Tax=unclassified Devosia TaxID=196773 RepID=UPI0006FE6FBE|nr:MULTISPECIES: hypothetical protein [unclassified Devosia]KQV04373.1 hypothetical protein ASC68_27365 [Devosia sp. Root105]KQW83266.1 hypothetical protein ASC89_27885 [Devosia sp. Root413D1]